MLMVVQHRQEHDDVADVEVHVGRRLSAYPELLSATLGELRKKRKTLFLNEIADSGVISHSGADIAWTLRRLRSGVGAKPEYALSIDIV